MRTEAQLAAAIELLDLTVKELQVDGATIDTTVRKYFHNKRYAGSNDRRQITNRVYSILRDVEILIWALNEADAEITGRNLFICMASWHGRDALLAFGTGRYGPPPLSEAERELIWVLPDRAEAPEFAVGNCPDWLEPSFRKRFGNNFLDEMKALNKRANLNIRVNEMKATPEQIRGFLREAEIPYRRSEWLPNCIKMGRVDLNDFQSFHMGEYEVQDEGSQIAALMVDPAPGHVILDLCAGAGGKTLAVGAKMRNLGKIFSTDISEFKLNSLIERAKRAGVTNIETRELPEDNVSLRAKILEPFIDRLDRVILDVPCSGSGTWRRSPDLRLRINPEKLEDLRKTQAKLMGEGAQMVKPGGRMTYITCSMLPEENEDQVKAFLKKYDEFHLLDCKDIWKKLLPDVEPPKNLSMIDECMQLTPGTHTCDGFFVAVFERNK